MNAIAMREAIAEAKLAALRGDVPVGAVIVCCDEVVARAGNERESGGDPTAHAEVLAIRRAAQKLGKRRLNGCTLYVTLEPCPMCSGTIIMSGIDRVFFGAYEPRLGCSGSIYNLPEDPAFGMRIPTYGGLLEEECALLMENFFSVKRD